MARAIPVEKLSQYHIQWTKESQEVWGPGDSSRVVQGAEFLREPKRAPSSKQAAAVVYIEASQIDTLVAAIGRNLTEQLKAGANKYIAGVAEETRKYVENLYARFHTMGVGGGERQSRAASLGKRSGAELPARTPHPHQNIGELLSKHIACFPRGQSSYTIAVQAGRTYGGAKKTSIGSYPRGVPLGLLAYWVENGHDVVWKMTPRMIAYLTDAINKNRRGYGSRAKRGPIQNNAWTSGKMIRFSYPRLPVWKQSLQFMLINIKKTLPAWINMVLNSVIEDAARAFRP